MCNILVGLFSSAPTLIAQSIPHSPFVEINEEKEISELTSKINEDTSFSVKFDDLEKVCEEVFPVMAEKISGGLFQ